MPENNNNINNEFNKDLPNKKSDPFDLPRINENNENNLEAIQTHDSGNKPMIEIPQSYYDKLAKEQLDKLEEEKRQQEMKAETRDALNETGKLLTFAILNAFVIFGLFYFAFNRVTWALLGIPVVIFVFTVLCAKKEKDKSAYPSTVMVGGMLVAIVTFILSMVQDDKNDIWMTYTVLAALVGFLGMFGSNIITKVMIDIKSVSALKGIGYILYFVLIIGGPVYMLKYHREEVYRYLFGQQVEVNAETEEEFVLKTLKTRYGVEFKCGIYATENDKINKKITYGKHKLQMDQFNRKYTERICRDSQNRDVLVQAKTYNESEVKYIVIDDYIDVLMLDENKEKIVKDIQGVTNAQNVLVYMYPKEHCTFYGDCVDVDDYFTNYENETNVDKQYKVSTELNFTKEIGNSSLEYINGHSFKYVLKVTGNYSGMNSNYAGIIHSILTRLNAMGYKNTYGYEITLLAAQNSVAGETEQVVYKVKGESNQEQVFKDPIEVNISTNK